MFSKINVSYNPLIEDSTHMPQCLIDALALPMLKLKDTSKRTGKSFEVSGFWVGREKWVGYPLFKNHGHKARRLTREEYETLVENAEIVIDRYCSKPEGFDAVVASMTDEIRAYLKGHMPE